MFTLELCDPVLFALIYCPPKPNSNFLKDFADFLGDFIAKYDKLMIVGDFNVHVCCAADSLAKEFINLLNAFDLTLQINVPTHQHGHTLDLVLTYGCSLNKLEVCENGFSDHKTIMFTFPSFNKTVTSMYSARQSRLITSATREAFRSAFSEGLLQSDVLNTDSSAEELLRSFNSTCVQALDQVAPLKTHLHKPKSEPWLNDTTRTLRRTCRRFERKWRKDRLQVSMQMFRDSLTQYQKAVKTARSIYFTDIINKNCHKPKTLFNVINSTINPFTGLDIEVSLVSCEDFLCFFVQKTHDLRMGLNPVSSDPSTLSRCTAVFSCFTPVTDNQLIEIVDHLKASGSPTDVMPPLFFKQVIDVVVQNLLSLINRCLQTGTFPESLKHATVRPLLKKQGMDPTILTNFRPISNLSFISKIIEKSVLDQIQSFMAENLIFEVFQSGFRKHHSTETALLKVSNDILLTCDSGNYAVLLLLDLTAAFDTVDHAVLLDRLEYSAGITGSALQWFRSYLTNRTFSVKLGDHTSSKAAITSGVPQGSILAPFLFSLYMLPLGSIFRKYGLSFHCYADDTQVYLPLKRNAPDGLNALLLCLSDVKKWLSLNFLNFNESKTELIVFKPSVSVTSTIPNLGELSPYVKQHVKNLGVVFDEQMKFDRQINTVVKSSFFQLRLLAKVKPFLSFKNLEKVIHAFITSRLDYCNSLYAGISQTALSRLQLVQNAAARFLTRSRKRDHITPVLQSLHWLPVRYRVDFKILLIVFKSLHGMAPSYISELLIERSETRSLRSSNQRLLFTPKTRLKSRGDRAFSSIAPRLWNELPSSIRLAPSVFIFKSRLKTYLFDKAFISG